MKLFGRIIRIKDMHWPMKDSVKVSILIVNLVNNPMSIKLKKTKKRILCEKNHKS